jgi:undecaprenyl diphosphate synthase
LTWESAYSELYWCKKHWPDFDEQELDKALEEYASRQRRFGK